MKKNLAINQVIVSGIFILLTGGCKKVYDFVDNHPGIEIKSCGIETFSFTPFYSDFQDTLSFTYNVMGDPVKATRPQPRTGAPNYLFRYKNGRLSEFIGVYGGGSTTETWHRYFYDAGGRIKIDSVYIFANIVNGGMSDPYDSYVTTYNYDDKNRITKATNTYSDGTDYVQEYQYNAEGNRIGSVYGQEVSFRRTNRIWMFIDRNYSVNDIVGSNNYNNYHMPGLINIPGGGTDEFLGNYYSTARIKYLCDNHQ